IVPELERKQKKMSKTQDPKQESKRVLLIDSNWVAWSRLTRTEIGSSNERTLDPEFKAYTNKHKRPYPPRLWMDQLDLVDGCELSDEGNESSSDSDESEIQDKSEMSEMIDSKNKKKSAQLMNTFKKFEILDKLWQIEERRTKDDADAVKTTMLAIRGGLSKSMQISYSSFDKPASLWLELKRTKDPANRKLDTSVVDAYKALSIRENQSIPDYLKEVREMEDKCTGLGETLHLGYEAQKNVRLKLDYCFSQGLILLKIAQYANIEELESTMNDLWDSYNQANNRNAKKEPTKPVAAVTIGNQDRKRQGSDQRDSVSKRNHIRKFDKCKHCSGSHDPKWDCDACWKCGGEGHLSKDCPNKKKSKTKRGDNNPVAPAAPAPITNAAVSGANQNNKPTAVGWAPRIMK
ncbi:UNVERIFIED_CONTAM: hypothetical protein HDU68_005368, partial [Siphonaria sp. JEL0065]